MQSIGKPIEIENAWLDDQLVRSVLHSTLLSPPSEVTKGAGGTVRLSPAPFVRSLAAALWQKIGHSSNQLRHDLLRRTLARHQALYVVPYHLDNFQRVVTWKGRPFR